MLTRVSTLRIIWLFLRYRMTGPEFTFEGRRYRLHVALYNLTWMNERQVEIPLALQTLAGADAADVLEIGNVLTHYQPAGHTVVDKYEDAERTIKRDVVDYWPSRLYRLIISVSTLEHVGWDEPTRDPGKFHAAVTHLTQILAPGGLLWATLPLGYNPSADAFVAHPDPGFETEFVVRKANSPWHWSQSNLANALQHAYGYTLEPPSARAICVLTYRRQALEA